MAKFPIIEYNRHDGARVVMVLPETVDLWDFLAWMDRKFMGATEAQLKKSNDDFDWRKASQQPKVRRK